jgi:hypothetical protein
MGCLANASDLPADPTQVPATPKEASSSSDETSLVDLPLWYARLVERPTWPEAAEPQKISRLFWRSSISLWPLRRRQWWGDRANELQDAGLHWKEAERVAFEEIMEELDP